MASHFRLPYGYKGAPHWPALYWPFGPDFDPLNLIADIPHSLYYISDIWRFTMIWSVIFSLVVYLPAGIWAFITLAKSRTLQWYILMLVPFIFVFAGSLASFVIGSIMGVALALVYNAGFFVMSTWIPFLWALIHILVVMVGSYSTITTVL
ncbi:uncharacterized protein BYT42DRAFT_582332 [Radiomyces spectabilis]|uniref:uncharacterized protein n=1 Tax=Radiomyces spectabilis TaxID=64574 RepID=UPI00222000D6|nr:uncharacterized protein BYT42DRAFT_582332 [Radiomyces spectabilis]KAI8370420.1 hypothetical protein BYT42DRAFT_582332 [Radiomyces spectabilis]